MHSSQRLHSPLFLIEPLEARIAPAAVVMITDIDGDQVAIKTNKGTVEQLTAALTLSGMDLTGTIREIDFSRVPLVGGVNPFAGTNLTITVVEKAPGGDGRVNVGYIDASASDGTGMDGVALGLGKVKIAGDLGQIDAGTGGAAVALKKLIVQSLGAWGTATQGANGSTTSNFSGTVGTIKITGGVSGATLAFDGTVRNVVVGGSFFGSVISGTGSLLKVSLGQGVLGGNFTADSLGTFAVKGSFNANMTIAQDIGSLQIGGDFMFGRITARDMTEVLIGGSIRGLDGVATSGSIAAARNLGSVQVGGNLQGGSATSSGVISAMGNIGSVFIRGSLIGPEVASDELPLSYESAFSSAIGAGGNIGKVRIAGDLTGPVIQSLPTGTHRALACSTISAGGEISSVKIGGSVIGTVGHVGLTSGNARIFAKQLGTVVIGGDFTGTSPFVTLPQIAAEGGEGRPAIEKLTIGGSLRLASVIAGSALPNTFGSDKNADAQIGAVFIGGDLASATVATLDTGSGVADNVNLTSRIASLTVRGNITGSSAVRAEHIVKVVLNGLPIALQPGPRNDTMPIVFAPGAGSIAEYT
jgi:hypothetical protein